MPEQKYVQIRARKTTSTFYRPVKHQLNHHLRARKTQLNTQIRARITYETIRARKKSTTIYGL